MILRVDGLLNEWLIKFLTIYHYKVLVFLELNLIIAVQQFFLFRYDHVVKTKHHRATILLGLRKLLSLVCVLRHVLLV